MNGECWWACPWGLAWERLVQTGCDWPHHAAGHSGQNWGHKQARSLASQPGWGSVLNPKTFPSAKPLIWRVFPTHYPPATLTGISHIPAGYFGPMVPSPPLGRLPATYHQCSSRPQLLLRSYSIRSWVGRTPPLPHTGLWPPSERRWPSCLSEPLCPTQGRGSL